MNLMFLRRKLAKNASDCSYPIPKIRVRADNATLLDQSLDYRAVFVVVVPFALVARRPPSAGAHVR
jgi:hypothetical protein